MQAEHIPVHLGAMPAAVAAVLDEDHAPGRAWILNDPYRGGTHLPDITVITPDLRRAMTRSDRVRRQPGPPRRRRRPHSGLDARRQHNARRRGRGDRAAGPRPGGGRRAGRAMRQPDQRRADLRAQLAAGRIGARRLARAPRAGRARDRPGGVQARSSTTRTAYPRLHRGAARRRPTQREDVLEAREGDLEIVLAATVEGDRLTLDSAAPPQHQGNLNCPVAVTRSACYFADPGAHRPRHPSQRRRLPAGRGVAPEGSLLNARSPAAVVGGNVETSSRVADVVLSAFGRALGQGTMNNVTIGSEHVVYYETIAGGQGACSTPTARARVHVAMSNTLNTPIEALELEFPMRVVRYACAADPVAAARTRRGRRGARTRGARAAELLVDHRAPAHAPPGPTVESRRARAQPARRPGAPAEGDRRAGAGPAAADRDPRRRRIRVAGAVAAMDGRRRPTGRAPATTSVSMLTWLGRVTANAMHSATSSAVSGVMPW